METVQLKILFKTLGDIGHTDENGEFWLARELYPILGYSQWKNFEGVIEKAKDACRNSGGDVENHFADAGKMVGTGSGATRDIDDIRLSRYAAYLIAVNGDPRKQEIAFAQAYFVTKTRQIEVLEKRMQEFERIDARDKLKITEKEFSTLVMTRGVDDRGLAMIRSRGDQELFGGNSTADMKIRLGIPKSRPLADFLPNVTLKAKDLATAMTTENSRRKDLRGLEPIGREHVQINKNVREALTKTGIVPEQLPPAEDLNKIMTRHKNELKALEQKQQREIEAATQGGLAI